MKHTIVIDDKNSAGKKLLELALELAKTNNSIHLTKEETADKEDAAIIRMIKSGLKHDFMTKSEQTAFVKQVKKAAK